MLKQTIYILALLVALSSCIEVKDWSESNKYDQEVNTYLYPFAQEATNVTTEIIIQTQQSLPEQVAIPEIPPLKYNKSWLMMLTQDDCKQVAYCSTWAAINGKPLSKNYFYDTRQLYWNDLPPDVYSLGKTLGSTDGAGNEVRFAITTTLAPGWDYMNHRSSVKPGYTQNYSRFYMPGGLNWGSIREMLNYGNGIAFHQFNIVSESEAMILKFFPIIQDTILHHLSGRGCKTLAEPNGNKNYVYAALKYAPIQAMTAQNGGTKVVYPYQYEVREDLHKVLQHREFNNNPAVFKTKISQLLNQLPAKRPALHIGVHGTDASWTDLLRWVNDNYGKEGDNSVWFPNMEEYYEYNYYRAHGETRLERIDEHTLKLTVHLPSEEYFYYPAITVNLPGISATEITSIRTRDEVTGLSYAPYKNENETKGVMLNIDFRRFLMQHAIHFVEKYEEDRSNHSNREDAIYFVNKLKASPQKAELLKRIN